MIEVTTGVSYRSYPNEFLVRWGEDGTEIQGAHVKYLVETIHNGVIVGRSMSAAQPVDLGAGQGFPLIKVLNDIQIDALSTVEKLRRENALLLDQIYRLKRMIQV